MRHHGAPTQKLDIRRRADAMPYTLMYLADDRRKCALEQVFGARNLHTHLVSTDCQPAHLQSLFRGRPSKCCLVQTVSKRVSRNKYLMSVN
jgi:hypothetical protein